ncbi:MAG: DUF4214 domain-containing protein, partial [Acidimicrobiales bacterium]
MSDRPVVTPWRILALVSVMAVLAAVLPMTLGASSPARPTNPAEAGISGKLNVVRDDAGLDGLVWDASLADGARQHAQLMANSASVYNHPSLGSNLNISASDWTGAAELVGSGTTIDAVIVSMLSRPEARASLAGDYQRIGVGVATRGDRSYVSVRLVQGSRTNGVVPMDEAGRQVAQVRRLYLAAFGREPDQPGLQNWVGQLQRGTHLNTVADGFVRSTEFRNRYGSPSNERYVELLYQNVLNRRPDPVGFTNWMRVLQSGTPRAQVLTGFSESPEFKRRSLGAGSTSSVKTNGVQRVTRPVGSVPSPTTTVPPTTTAPPAPTTTAPPTPPTTVAPSPPPAGGVVVDESRIPAPVAGFGSVRIQATSDAPFRQTHDSSGAFR